MLTGDYIKLLGGSLKEVGGPPLCCVAMHVMHDRLLDQLATTNKPIGFVSDGRHHVRGWTRKKAHGKASHT